MLTPARRLEAIVEVRPPLPHRRDRRTWEDPDDLDHADPLGDLVQKWLG
jgi:hypothetical protein